MAISVVQIANMALGHLGSSSIINSLTEDSVEARQANIWYPIARDQALSALNWPFARGRKVLALHNNTAPILEWTYRYQLPADYLVARYIENPLGPKADPIPYDIEQAEDGTLSLLTNLAPETQTNSDGVVVSTPTLVYTKKTENIDLFTLPFIIAFSYLLASFLAPMITRSQALAATQRQNYAVALRIAESLTANEKKTEAPRETEWVRGRE